ncbi:MAG: hypothetical protein Q8P50_15190 [Bacillota bacterium]|nr:hypothetical protein [Bacillota bacterium]
MATQAKRYRGAAYWEAEAPRTADTARVRISYYADASKLQVAQLYRDRETGELRRGKTVTFDSEDLALHPQALELIMEVLQGWRG